MLKYVPPEELSQRHIRLMHTLPNHSVFILSSASITLRNSDVEYPFRQNSDYWYMTGLDDPDCILIFVKDGANNLEKLFFKKGGDTKEGIWTEKKTPEDTIKQILNVNKIHTFDDLDEVLNKLINKETKVFFNPKLSNADENNRLILELVNSKTKFLNYSVLDTKDVLKQLTVVKSGWELDQLRHSAQVNTIAFSKVNEVITDRFKHYFADAQPYFQDLAKPGLFEYQLEAELIYAYKQHNLNWSYPPIVASAENATILHYTKNNSQIADTDLILIDAGCEYNYYASDVTRTISAGSGMTLAQQEIYDLVLKANMAVINKLISVFGAKRQTIILENGGGTIEITNTVDLTLKDLHQISVETIAQGLIDLNLLAGSLEEVLKTESYKKYYMHSVGHWLGLDVHDSHGYYKDNKGFPLKLKPGMVFTVEPGIYLPVDDQTIPPELRGIGVRIEDDIAITETGVEILTEGVGK